MADQGTKSKKKQRDLLLPEIFERSDISKISNLNKKINNDARLRKNIIDRVGSFWSDES